jgi:hypothetical protein
MSCEFCGIGGGGCMVCDHWCGPPAPAFGLSAAEVALHGECVREVVGRELDAAMSRQPCPSCDGRGMLVPPACSWDESDRTCYRCGGTGLVAIPPVEYSV